MNYMTTKKQIKQIK